MTNAIRVLYVDDNSHDRELVRDALELEDRGFVLTEAPSRADFERLLAAGKYDLVLSDFNILGFRGIQVLDVVHSRAPGLPVVIVTGTGSEEVAVEAMKRGAMDYVIKSPKHIKKLPSTIRAALRQRRTREERDRLFDLSIDMLCISDYEGHFMQVNPAWEKTLGWRSEELLAKPFIEFVHPEDRDTTLNAMEAIKNGLTRHQFENRYLSKAGGYRWLWWNSQCLAAERRVFSVARDVTDRKRADEMIRTSLREKESLLKEIHHRVKNNLQIISSLVSLQSEGIRDLALKTAFVDTRHRIRAMASVHERLLSSQNLSGIDFGDFLKSLVYELLGAFGNPPVTPSLDVEPVVLGIDTAIPCCLIVDELVTNSLRHAFPGGGQGSIALRLHRLEESTVELLVGDDGAGMPPDKDFRSLTSMGMVLVMSLVEQINGSIELLKKKGTVFRILFRA